MYSSLVDLKNYIPEDTIIQLSDDNDTGDVDTEKTDDCIRRADDFINAHLEGRYTLPLATVPIYIRDISAKLAIYFLYKRSLALTLPEAVKEDYDYAVKALYKIQQGKINPFATSEEPVFFKTNKHYSDRVFVTKSVPNGNMFTPYPLNPMVADVSSNPNQINLNSMLL